MSIPTGSGWILTTASAINDAGQISGTGLYNGRTWAFLLAPVKEGPVRAHLHDSPMTRDNRIG